VVPFCFQRFSISGFQLFRARASIAQTFHQAQPFYVAPDYHPRQPGSPDA